jgi:hypothetical protein
MKIPFISRRGMRGKSLTKLKKKRNESTTKNKAGLV